jgi:hypothetical protein
MMTTSTTSVLEVDYKQDPLILISINIPRGKKKKKGRSHLSEDEGLVIFAANNLTN